MRLISSKELKAKLEGKDDFKLVMVLGELAWKAKHIPGSLYINTPQEGLAILNKDEEVVVYCADVSCPASIFAYNFLDSQGYKRLWRFAGGIAEWEREGYPMEGDEVSLKKGGEGG